MGNYFASFIGRLISFLYNKPVITNTDTAIVISDSSEGNKNNSVSAIQDNTATYMVISDSNGDNKNSVVSTIHDNSQIGIETIIMTSLKSVAETHPRCVMALINHSMLDTPLTQENLAILQILNLLNNDGTNTT